jgi:hypothetical protein
LGIREESCSFLPIDVVFLANRWRWDIFICLFKLFELRASVGLGTREQYRWRWRKEEKEESANGV